MMEIDKAQLHTMLDDCAKMVTQACIEANQEVFEKDTKPMILKLAQDLKNQTDLTTELADALEDCAGGLQYIRDNHGDLYGVGFDRALDKAKAALKKAGR